MDLLSTQATSTSLSKIPTRGYHPDRKLEDEPVTTLGFRVLGLTFTSTSSGSSVVSSVGSCQPMDCVQRYKTQDKTPVRVSIVRYVYITY